MQPRRRTFKRNRKTRIRTVRRIPRPLHSQLALNSSFLNQDVKVAQVTQTTSNITSLGTVVDLLGGMTVGTGMRNNFIGRKFQPIGMYFSYSIRHTGTNMVLNNTFNPMVRVSIVQWEDSALVSVPPAITAIYENQNSVHTAFELTNWETIDVLHDAIHTPYSTISVSSTEQAGQTLTAKGYIPFSKLKPVLYNDATASWQKGDILLAFYCDNVNNGNLVMDGFYRVYFTDA